jgi:kumamolisin
MTDDRIAILGSTVNRSESIRAAADPNQIIDATIVVRRPASSSQTANDLLAGRGAQQTRDEIEKQMSADPDDMKAVTDFARQSGLRVVEESPAKRMVRVEGPIRAMNAAFGIELANFSKQGGAPFLSYEGPIRLPPPVSAAVSAILGLHREPIDKRS